MTTNVFFRIFFSAFLVIPVSSCHGQTTKSGTGNSLVRNKGAVVGGPFENAEFMYIGMPKEINAVDTSAGWAQPGQKLLVTGTIFKRDGKTPAPDVILYYYHTDIQGYYADKTGLDKRVVRHGYIRGWVKSDKNGKYAIFTVRPGAYPDRQIPAHIHPSIKEPDLNEYYIDEFVFDDDKLLNTGKRKALENRGGSGILRPLSKGNLQIAEHNIILGLNIPNYPAARHISQKSGVEVGLDSPSFRPFHASGPDKGTRTCPFCKYGRYYGILYFVGNQPDWNEIRKWLIFLEQQSEVRGKYLKVYFVYGNTKDYNKENRIRELQKIGAELNLRNLALTFVPSFDDRESEMYLNEINPAKTNTFVVYKQSNIIAKFVELQPTVENFRQLSNILETTKCEFVDLQTQKLNK